MDPYSVVVVILLALLVCSGKWFFLRLIARAFHYKEQKRNIKKVFQMGNTHV